jgi:hypothetical protein
MGEKRQPGDRVVKVLIGAGELFPESEIVYVTMFPRHVERCCDSEGHMTEEDVWVTDGVCRDIDQDVKEIVTDLGQRISVMEWWDMLGLEGEMSVKEVKRLRVVGMDGVHLTPRTNKVAAISLCLSVRYHCGGWSEELNSRILLLAYMVYI